VYRARKMQKFLSQPFAVAEVFTNMQGKLVELKDTIAAFKGILAGDYDHLPEQAFFMVGPISEVEEKAKKLASEVRKDDPGDKKDNKKGKKDRVAGSGFTQAISRAKQLETKQIEAAEKAGKSERVDQLKQKWATWNAQVEDTKTKWSETQARRSVEIEAARVAKAKVVADAKAAAKAADAAAAKK